MNEIEEVRGNLSQVDKWTKEANFLLGKCKPDSDFAVGFRVGYIEGCKERLKELEEEIHILEKEMGRLKLDHIIVPAILDIARPARPASLERRENKMFFKELTPEENWIAMWQYGYLGDFHSALFKVICVADEGNLDRLSLGFSDEVSGYRKYTQQAGWWREIQKKIGK